MLVFFLQENKVIPKFKVNLPKKVFEKTRDGIKSGEMKVVVLSATSETLFQVNDGGGGGNFWCPWHRFLCIFKK